MSKEDVIEVEGVVVEAMPNAMFLVRSRAGTEMCIRDSITVVLKEKE